MLTCSFFSSAAAIFTHRRDKACRRRFNRQSEVTPHAFAFSLTADIHALELGFPASIAAGLPGYH
jgi:hypothetical protein